MGLMIKMILAAFWLLVVPAVAGAPFFQKKEIYSVRNCFLTGYAFLFAVMEVLTLLMIWLGLPLHILTVCYGSLGIIMVWWGMWCLLKKDAIDAYMGRLKKGKIRLSIPMILALALILLQMYVVVRYAHMDADDSFYVGTAVTDIHTDTIFSISPYTGYAYTKIPSRYILSPFPVFLAVVSQLCGEFHPAIMAHTVFPPVFLLTGYAVLWGYGKKWFQDNEKSRWIFMLLSAVVVWFSGYSVYSSGNFQMVRIWQGKALLTGVFLPFLFFLCMELLVDKKGEYPWISLFLTELACCLLSSMGIILAPVLTGIFLLISLHKQRDLRRLLYGVICCLPPVALGCIYFFIQ